jgi:ABC-type ATPase with predicted acetyltransferase domain
MGTDDLLCAACGGRVGDARCPTCRASRQHLRDTRPSLPAGPVLLAALLVLLLVLALA